MPVSLTDIQVVLLGAGKQERYGGATSKAMMTVHGRPAISYLLDSLLEHFDQSQITTVCNRQFGDLADYMLQHYPMTNVIYDDHAGQGSAQSLKAAMPFSKPYVMTCDTDLYVTPVVVDNILAHSGKDQHFDVVCGTTPRTDVVPTHRAIQMSPTFRVLDRGNPAVNADHANLGVHLFRSDVLCHIADLPDVMDLIYYLQTEAKSLIAHVYADTLLHIAHPSDLLAWQEHFASEQ